MYQYLPLFLSVFLSFSLNAQVQKGSVGIVGELKFLNKEVIDNSLLIGSPQTFFTFPTVDYYFSKRWSAGGSFSFNKFNLSTRVGEAKIQQVTFQPHVKYGINFSNFNFFISASSYFFKETSDKVILEVNEFGAKVGTGLQWFISPNIALETWWQVPVFSEFAPNLYRDLTYTFGLKFYNHKNSKRRLPTDLFDYYLDEYNIRFGFNTQGFQIFQRDNRLFSNFQFSYENFFKDYFVFYLNYRGQNDLNQVFESVRVAGSRLNIGFKTYFPFKEGYYFTLKTGLVRTNTDAFFTRVIRGSFGLNFGAGLEYFFPKKAVLKGGINWQGTATFDFRATYSNAVPYLGLEYFINRQISIEPRLNYFLFNAEEEINSFPNFEIVETKERTVIFEIRIRTLIYREAGFFSEKT